MLTGAALLVPAVLFGLALTSFPLPAQSPTAGFVGIVRDSTGAAVPGATIKVRNTETNSLRELTTDQVGSGFGCGSG